MALNEYDEQLEGQGVAQANEYDALIDQALTRQTGDLRQSMREAVKTPPDAKAKNLQIAERLRIPIEMVERNPQLFREREAVERVPYDDLIRTSPQLAEWLKTPVNAGVAHDDLDNLTALERALGIARNVTGAGAAGAVRFLGGLWGGVQFIEEALGADEWAKAARKGVLAGEQVAARLRGPQAGAGYIEQHAYGGVENIGQMVPAIVLGVLTGGTTAGLAATGAVTAGQSYAQGREGGLGVGRAAAFGGLQGVIEIATEYIPMKWLVGDVAKKTSLVKTLLHQLGTEIPTEQLATLAQDFNQYLSIEKNQGKTVSDYWNERGDAATATFISTLVAAGGTTIIGHATRRVAEQLGEVAQASKTLQRSPETVAGLVEQIAAKTGTDTAYLPIDRFTEYWRDQGQNPAAVAERLTGDPHAYNDAVAAGHELPVPMPAYVTQIAADPSASAFFAPEMKVAPELMNGREAESFIQNLDQSATSTPTPDVQQTFEQLVNVDNVVARVEAHAGAVPLFTTAESAGMSAEDFVTYRGQAEQASAAARAELAQTIASERAREQDAERKAARVEIRAAVAADVHAQPVYRAEAAIRRGTHPDGTPLIEGAVPMKLAKAELVGRYTPEELATLRRRQLYAADGGASPDVVATFFGFSSGDALVRALLASSSMHATIETETTRRMRERFGDPLSADALRATAVDAVHSEHRQQVIHAELKALTRGLAEGTIPPHEAIVDYAQRRIAATRLRDLRPGLFLMAAQRAAAQAFELKESNRRAAVTAKHRELVSLALYREAIRVRTDIDARVTWVERHDTDPARARTGKAGADYLDQWDGFLDRYEFKTVSLKTLDRRAKLRDWIAAQTAAGVPVDLPQSLLDDSTRVNYRQLTVAQFADVTDAMKQLVHLARLKTKLLTAKDAREFDAVVADATASIIANVKRPPKRTLETRLPQDQAARIAAQSFAAHRKLNNIIRQLDGWRDGGVFWERVMRPLNAAADAETVEHVKMARELADAFKVYAGEERTLYQKTFVPALNDSLSKMGRLMIALNWGNEGNRDRLLSDRKRRWNAGQIQAVLDTLDARDVAFVNRIWAIVNTYWPEIEAKQQRVFGVAPAKVEAAPFTARGGAFTGGYFPIAYEGQLSAAAGSALEADLADSVKRAAYVQATTRRGHTEARVAHSQEPLRLDFGVISEHLTQVVHDLTHHEALIDVARLLSNKAVQDAIVDHHGAVVYNEITGAIRDVAWGAAPGADWMRPLHALRQGVVVARLGWNVVTTALQPTQALLAVPRVGLKHLAHGYLRWTKNAATMQHTARWIRERSSFMKTRGLTQQREINEIRNRIGLDQGRVSGWIHDGLAKLKVPPALMPAIADTYFYVIQKGQQLADIPVWLAAYEQAMADPANVRADGTVDEDRAVALADQVVIDTQGSGHIKDLSRVERDARLKIFTTFYSFKNLLLNQTIESFARADVKSARALGRLAVDAFVLLFASAVLESWVRDALKPGDEDDETTLTERLIRNGLAQFAGMFIGARELEGVAKGFRYQGPAGLQWVGDLGRLGEQIGQMELDADFWRALNRFAGDVTPYPAVQVERTVEGLLAIMENRTDNPLVLLTGPPRER